MCTAARVCTAAPSSPSCVQHPNKWKLCVELAACSVCSIAIFRSDARLYSTQPSFWRPDVGSSSSPTTTHRNRPGTELPWKPIHARFRPSFRFRAAAKMHTEEAKPSVTLSVLLSLSHAPPSPCWTPHCCGVSGLRAAGVRVAHVAAFVDSGATPCVRTEAPLLLNPGQTFFPPWWWGRRGDQTVVDGGSEPVLTLVVATVQKMRFTEEALWTVA